MANLPKNKPRKHIITIPAGFLLGDRDSNPDSTVQSRMSCRWTISQINQRTYYEKYLKKSILNRINQRDYCPGSFCVIFSVQDDSKSLVTCHCSLPENIKMLFRNAVGVSGFHCYLITYIGCDSSLHSEWRIVGQAAVSCIFIILSVID